jgi:AcrR family transcriptional regulator
MRPVLTDEEVASFRADVCRVAEVLFARHGVAGVTMRQIAAELGCSPTTAYRYFKNKEEIQTAVRAAAFNRFCDVIEDAARSNPDPRESARNVGQAYLTFALENPDAYRMMFEISQAAATGNADLAEALARSRRAMVTYLGALFDEGIAASELHGLGQMLWAAAHGLVMLRLSGIVVGDNELRKLHEKTMSALMRGTYEARTNKRATSAGGAGELPPLRKPGGKTS